MKYEIRQLVRDDFFNDDIRIFITEGFIKGNELHNYPYNWSRFPIMNFIRDQRMTMCFRDGKPVGFLMATLGRHFFDVNIKVLKQNYLFSLPNTRSSLYLLKDFIDFGKTHANYVITNIGSETNIKQESLEKLGFKRLEELYLMEN